MLGEVPVWALKGIDFYVKEGEFVSIIGPSGSGKSTLLNMIGALDLPTAGQVIIGGKDISKMNNNELAELRQQIGFVFQFFNLISRLTAFKNVELSMSIQKIPKSKRIRKTEEILRMVGLGDRMYHKPSELSGGEQQRVAIARALAKNPKYLLLDEPTGNVDTKTRDKIMDLIIDLNKKYGMTIIIITHDPEIAKRSRRMVHIVDGRMIESSEEYDFLNKDVMSNSDYKDVKQIVKEEV
ncbi:MAG: ABC transporter ATP-binding protein [Promethearchaeota archaeon]